VKLTGKVRKLIQTLDGASTMEEVIVHVDGTSSPDEDLRVENTECWEVGTQLSITIEHRQE